MQNAPPETKSDYSLSADLIITLLFPFFLSAKIIVHLLKYTKEN
jgi:hypothetical protein